MCVIEEQCFGTQEGKVQRSQSRGSFFKNSLTLNESIGGPEPIWVLFELVKLTGSPLGLARAKA